MPARSAPTLVETARAARQAGQVTQSLALFEAAAAAQPAHTGLRMEIAADLRALGRWPEAAAAYKIVLAQKPGHIAARLGLGQCARQQGDRAAALAHFEAALATDPAHLWARLETAAELRAMGRIADAEDAYRAVLVTTPEHKTALLGLAACARGRGDVAASIDLHRRAIAADPADTWARMQFAADLMATRQIAQAEAEYARIVETAPDHGGALLAMGRAARRRGDRAMALAWNHRAAQTAPRDVWCRLECATDLRELGELDEARAAAMAALAIDPQCAPALLSLGLTERQARRHEQAYAAFAGAHAVQPDRAEPLLQMAIEHRALGRQSACDTLLAQAEALEPDNLSVVLQRAEQARMAGDILHMHALLANARGRWLERPALDLAYVDSLALLGRLPEALDVLDALGWRDLAVELKRVSLSRRGGLWPRALALARRTVLDWPVDFSAWMERLACETLLGSEAAIDTCLAHAPAVSPREHARLARARGQVHEHRGETEAAFACYASAEELDPDHAETPFLVARLALATLETGRARGALTAYVRATAPITRLRGRTPNISQTHFGQILDEYTLDALTLAALRSLRDLPPEQCIEQTLGVVAANPDSTAAAVALIDTLCDAGYGGSPRACNPKPQPRTAIPKTIVQFWDTPEVPQDVRDMMQSWTDLHQDFAVRRFDSAGAHAFIGTHHGRPAADLFGRVQGAAQKADVFRLGYLAALGGIYADGDDRCHAHVSTILPPRASLVVYREDIGTLGNNFIAATPAHPILIRAWRLALASLARGDEDTVWLSTGPGLLTRAVAGEIADSGDRWVDWFPGLAILSRRELFRAVAIHCLAGYKATGHWSGPPSGRLTTAR